MKKNKGYTLIETIIVIAIIMILAGASFISIGIINRAKYSAATTSLQNQMSSLWVKTKALSQAKVQTSPSATENDKMYPLCMKIRHDAAGTYSIILGYDTGSKFVEKEAGVVETTLPKIITLTYKESSSGQKASFADADNLIIEFNKSDGSVKYGAGTYEVKYGNSKMSVVLDDATGKHYIK